MKKFNHLFTRWAVLTLLIAMGTLTWSCQNQSATQAESAVRADTLFDHPDWANNATIYEVNIRQYSPEGTFDAFTRDIPRLKKMGVEILWLMPIHPIGEKNRKGKLGSYYSVKDYKAINPEFGTMDDLQQLVETAHANDMKVIIDWVANHTAWDHVWTRTHPDWFTHDEDGNFKPPVKDWTDVIELDYSNQDMRDAMADAMKYWVREANIDGYRCDVAGSVPTDFWNRVRKELDAIKPVFMLAEAEQVDLHNKAFDMTYAWEFHHLTNAIAKGEAGPEDIDEYMAKEDTTYPPDAYRMYFTSNHDENSWNGSAVERYGDATKAMAVLASTIDGMPLVYNGQESRIDERLEFFRKDTIKWDSYPLSDFYTKLLELNQDNPAMWNGTSGGKFVKVKTDNDDDVYAYKLVKGENEVMVVLNLTDAEQSANLEDFEPTTYTQVFSGKERTIGDTALDLAPWGYLVLEK